jgi:glycosyltransferase involved in cell wall biosynthesis
VRATISVVIPVKNDARFLETCLMALACQTRLADEIVVVDNGSTDDSAAVAARFGARVIVESRPGIPAASAAGFDAASCEILARLDADSVPAVDWIERVGAAFDERPALAAITGGARFTDGPRWLRAPAMAIYLVPYYLLVTAVLGHVPLFGSNCALRRSEWLRVRDEVHRGDPEVHDDIDLSFHLGPAGRIRFDPSLRMGIAIRPFRRGALRRQRRAMHTLAIHWPAQLPWLRIYRRTTSRFS